MVIEAPRMGPSSWQLTVSARGADCGIDVAYLVRHLPRCVTCARRWALIQRDACIGII